jgi:xanthine dehydrogenase accessory factor
LGFDVLRTAPDQSPHGVIATVICSLGNEEEKAVRAALDADVGLIAVVASRRRGTAMIESMGLGEAEQARIRTPAGLDIGARTPPEIALSILGQIVQAVRVEGLVAPEREIVGLPQQAIDPVCGMTVVVVADTPHFRLGDTDYWFCNPGCRDHYAAQAAV